MAEDIEIVDAEVINTDIQPRVARQEERSRTLTSVTVGACAAATGFAAGVATAAVVGRRRTRGVPLLPPRP